MSYESVDDGEGIEQFAVHLEGKVLAVEGGRGIDGTHVYLILAVLHVYKRDIASVEELGIPTAMAVDGLVGCLFEEVLVVIGAAENATIALSWIQEGIFLHDGLQVDAEVDVLLHTFLSYKL